MRQTIAEKVLSRKNLSGKPVKAGDIIDARVDGIMLGRNAYTLDDHVISGGLANGVPRLWDTEKVYIMLDHFQPPYDAKDAKNNKRSREFAARLGAKHFHDATPGIHHQMMCDFGYALPGELIIGTDSHTLMYGALNAASTGIGEADAAYAATFGDLWFSVPSTVKVVLKGKLPRYPFAKDIAMHLAAACGDDFAQYRAIEYIGPAAEAMSLDSRMCLSAQSVELGAKFAFFAADEKTIEYVTARTHRAFEAAHPDPGADYERTIEVEVDRIPFYVSKPHRFRNGVPVQEAVGAKINQASVGTCANGRLEDFTIVSRILRGRKIAPGVRFLIQPASYAVFRQCLDASILQDIVDAGAQVLAPGCAVCRTTGGYLNEGEVDITTATRNHKGRMGSIESFVYLGGPATVAASAVAGEIVDPTEVLREIGLI